MKFAAEGLISLSNPMHRQSNSPVCPSGTVTSTSASVTSGAIIVTLSLTKAAFWRPFDIFLEKFIILAINSYSLIGGHFTVAKLIHDNPNRDGSAGIVPFFKFWPRPEFFDFDNPKNGGLDRLRSAAHF